MEQKFRLDYCFDDISFKFPLSYFNEINSQNIYKSCLEIIYKKFVGDNNGELDNCGLYKRSDKPALCDILNLSDPKSIDYERKIDTFDGDKHFIEIKDKKINVIDTWVTPLHLFIKLYIYNTDDDKLILDMMDIYLNNFPENINIKDKNGETSFYMVIASMFSNYPKRKYKLLRFLFERGTNINLIQSQHGNFTKFDILHHLIFMASDFSKDCLDCLYCFDFILKSGISINSTDVNGKTILHRGNHHNIELVKYLLDNNLDVNIKDKDGNNVLHTLINNVCTYGSIFISRDFYVDSKIEILKIIIGKIVNINDTNNNNESPIDILCNGNLKDESQILIKIKQILLDNGSNQPKIKIEPKSLLTNILSNIPFINYLTNINDNNAVNSNSVGDVTEEKLNLV